MRHRVQHVLREALFGPLLHRIMPILWSEQWRDPAEVRDAQRQQARQALLQAYDAFVFYRRKLRLAGVTREEICRDGIAWSQIPPLDRDELGRAQKLARHHPLYAWRTTGGSSGSRLRIPINRDAYCWATGGLWRGLQWWGVEIGAPGAVLLPSGGSGRIRALAGFTRDWALNWMRLPADEHVDGRMPQILDALQRFRPAFVYGYPSVLARLARHLIRGNRFKIRPRLIVAAGEHLYTFQRRTIEQAFACPVAEEYGCSEVGSIAFQCPAGKLHVTAECVLLEVADVSQEAFSKHTGHALVTALHNRLTPLIRYLPGDLAVLEPAPCACGRGLPVVRILGRVDEIVALDGRIIPSQEIVDRLASHVRDVEGINVRLVLRGSTELCFQFEQEDLGRVAFSEMQALGAELGCRIAVEAVARIPRTRLGKVSSFALESAQPP